MTISQQPRAGVNNPRSQPGQCIMFLSNVKSTTKLLAHKSTEVGRWGYRKIFQDVKFKVEWEAYCLCHLLQPWCKPFLLKNAGNQRTNTASVFTVFCWSIAMSEKILISSLFPQRYSIAKERPLKITKDLFIEYINFAPWINM